MLELYQHGSSACAAKVRFALAEKGLEWTSHYLDLLKGEQFAPQFLAINPKAVVPVLIHDSEVVPESTVMRNGVGDFDDFLKEGGAEGLPARTLKWQWIQLGLAAPGAADKIQLYDRYLHKMEATLADSAWLVGTSTSAQ